MMEMGIIRVKKEIIMIWVGMQEAIDGQLSDLDSYATDLQTKLPRKQLFLNSCRVFISFVCCNKCIMLLVGKDGPILPSATWRRPPSLVLCASSASRTRSGSVVSV
jgi:hypothetical protein